MHSAVLQNKKYIKFAEDNTVEVMAMSRIDEGVQKKDKKAETYEATDASGNKVALLVEFPNLSVEDINKMNSSKAGSYNDTGAIPHTSFVDPFTLEKIEGLKGGMSAGQVSDAATAARKAIEEKHGKADFTRKDLAKIDEAEATVREEVAKQRLDKALAAVAKLEKAASGWPELAVARVTKIKGLALDAASAQVDQLEELSKTDAKAAKTKLAILLGRLKGTDLQARIEALLEQL